MDIQLPKNFIQAVHFHHIPHFGRSTVPFNQAGAGWGNPGSLPSAFDSALLP